MQGQKGIQLGSIGGLRAMTQRRQFFPPDKEPRVALGEVVIIRQDTNSSWAGRHARATTSAKHDSSRAGESRFYQFTA